MSDTVASQQALICRIVYSFIGFITGISVFILWLVVIKPESDATVHIITAGGLSGVLAAWNMFTHIMHLRDYWRTWLKGLKYFMIVGVMLAILAAVECITYIILGATRHGAVWCFVSLKWAVMLAWYSRSYRNEFADLSALLEF